MSDNQVAVVTGGRGFNGKPVVGLLFDRGCEVRVIDNLVGGREVNLAHHAGNANLHFINSDIRALAPGASVFKGVSRGFHFAGIGDIVPSIEQPIEYMSVNAQGTVQVLECAREAGAAKLVYSASSSWHGLAETPTREDH